MGFSEDTPMESAWRDARIARIYEGTNEINRMLILGMLIKKAMKGHVDLLGPAMKVQLRTMIAIRMVDIFLGKQWPKSLLFGFRPITENTHNLSRSNCSGDPEQEGIGYDRQKNRQNKGQSLRKIEHHCHG